jgi:hypothetical protein
MNSTENLTACEYLLHLKAVADTAFSYGERLDILHKREQIVKVLNYLEACLRK